MRRSTIIMYIGTTKVDEKIISPPTLAGNSQSQTVARDAVPNQQSQVNSKKKNQVALSITSQLPDMASEVDQLYGQVDKKKQKSKEKEVCPEQSGPVYSVVNKPSS